MIKNIKWLFLVSLTFVACNNDDETPVYNSSDNQPLTAGTADFSKYVALGDSFAAGYSDNALFIEGQKGAYPNILAQQFTLVGGGDFKTPFMADNVGGLLPTSIGEFPRLYFNGTGPASVGLPPFNQVSTTTLAPLGGSFNNMGIPGAKSFHLVTPGYGTLNPYFTRFASSPTTTVIQDALVQTPTFFSLWIGGNDVLTYATSGGIGVNQTGNLDLSTYGDKDITDPNVYANVFSGLVTALTANGAKGVVANLPYVNALPYFTTVPYNAVPLAAANATQLNAGFAAYNGGLQIAKNLNFITEEERVQRTVTFQEGQNAVVIVDEYLTDISGLNPGLIKMRQATSKDLLILPSRNFIGTLVDSDPDKINGVSVPLADGWILSKNEIAEVKVATDAYNITIESVASAKGLAFVDTKAIMNRLILGGITGNGFTLTSAYVTGGAFSLDGIHPSPRGYALIANEFIKAINAKYGSNLKGVSFGDYRILFPADPLAF